MEEPKPFEDGTQVVMFTKRFHNGGHIQSAVAWSCTYTYAAVRIPTGRWYVTNTANPSGYDWDQLLKFIQGGAAEWHVWVADSMSGIGEGEGVHKSEDAMPVKLEHQPDWGWNW